MEAQACEGRLHTSSGVWVTDPREGDKTKTLGIGSTPSM